MPLANVVVPPFPDVPRAPGVPPVLTAIGTASFNVIMLAADVASVVRMFAPPAWGIFKNNLPLFVGDSVISFDYRREWRVSDFPIEQGGFASYDKVSVPRDVRLTFAVSGSPGVLASLIPGAAGWMAPANRKAALATLDAAAASLDLVTVVTPEARYESCNIVHYDYRREARAGTTLIRVDVWLVEIRIAPSPQFTQTQTESSTAPVQDGAVQPTPPPPTPPPPPATPATGGSGLTGLNLQPPAPSGAGTGLTIEPLPLGPFQ